MKGFITLLLLGAGMTLITASAFASNVAVVDSGTFFEHKLLQGRQWTNVGEVAGNLVDDDHNGKVDDTVGWNFAENYNRVFYPEHLSRINPVVFKFMTLISRIQDGSATAEEKQFWEKDIKALPKEKKAALAAHLNYYGQFSHSTHVSGIVAIGNPLAKIQSDRVFPDSRPSEYESDPEVNKRLENLAVADYGAKTWNILYLFMGNVGNMLFSNVADYIHETQMDVANYSLGTPMSMIAKLWLKVRMVKNPTPEQLSTEAIKAFSAYIKPGKQWLAKAPNTLFVIAAGNDATDNDKLPEFPASLDADNAISVAATQGYSKLASFSNIGAKSVHVAAPGVSIMSTVPSKEGDLLLPMSGTSMAAPFVTMMASRVKDINPTLAPSQVKEILMGTVDYKDWLKGKVASGGVVNPDRAYQSAMLSKTASVKDAIAQARKEVADVPAVEPTKLMSVEETDPELQAIADSMVF